MESLSGPAKAKALKVVALLCYLRAEGKHSEDQIAKRTGFGSAEAMYVQLKNWGLPGLLPHEEQAVKAASDDPKTAPKARRSSGEATELPPVSRAVGLFEAALEQLQRDLGAIERLTERYKDGRFEAERVLPGTDEDGNLVHVLVSDGADQAPSVFLTRLVAVYLLAEQPIEALLTALHPEPESADTEQLDLHIHGKKTRKGIKPGLIGEARRVARLVRGGTLREGRTTGSIGPVEREVLAYVRERREEGASDEKILEELKEGQGLTHSVLLGPEGETTVHPWPGIGMEDLKRLGNLGAWSAP